MIKIALFSRTFSNIFFCRTLCCTISDFLAGGYQRPQRPWWPPLVPPLAAGGPALLYGVCPLLGPWPPRPPFCGPLWCPPAPLPRCAAGSWPDSHSGGGTGLGVGSGGGMFGFGSLGAAWVGMTDSSRARLFAGSLPAPSVANSVAGSTKAQHGGR